MHLEDGRREAYRLEACHREDHWVGHHLGAFRYVAAFHQMEDPEASDRLAAFHWEDHPGRPC